MKTIILILVLSLKIFSQSEPLLNLFDGVTHLTETVEYKRLIDSVGGSISDADLTAIDVFVTETSSIRSKIVRFNPFAGNDLTTACVPLFRGNASGVVFGSAIDINSGTTAFVSGDYSRTTGLGNATNTTAYLKTGIIANNIDLISRNDVSIGVWSLTDLMGDVCSIGASDGTNAAYMFLKNSSSLFRAILNQNPGTGGLTNANTLGLHLASRLALGTYNYYRNADSVYTHTQSSTGEPPVEYYVFGLNNGGVLSLADKHKLSGYIIAAGFTTAEAVILYNAWLKLKSGWGR